MSRRIQAAVITVVVAIFVMGFGVARATTSSGAMSVKACPAQGGYLTLASPQHRCGNATAKVGLGRVGSSGITRATGTALRAGTNAKAKAGAVTTLSLSSNTAATGPTVKVGNWTYTTSCTIDGSGTVTVRIATVGPAGTTYDYYEHTQTDHDDAGTTTGNDGRVRSISGEEDYSVGAAVNNSFRSFIDIYLLASDKSAQHVSGVIEADASPTQGDTKCLVQAQVVPSA